MKLKLQKRRGFTLVELLIVIVVIGILASGMMLAAGSATESAKAATAISELRSAKAAGLMWFADHSGLESTALADAWRSVAGTGGTASIDKYMDNSTKSKLLRTGTFGTDFYIGTEAYKDESPTFYEKLKGQAGGVLFLFNTPPPNLGNLNSLDVTSAADIQTTKDKGIWMKVR